MVHIPHTHTFIKNKFMNLIPQGNKTILVSSLAASVQRNQCGATNKSKHLHRNVKAAVSDVSSSFQAHLRVNPTLDASGQRSLILQRKLWGYKSVIPPTKHHKATPAKLVFHIYRKKQSHLSTSIRQIIL